MPEPIGSLRILDISLSYCFYWWRERDLNPRPRDYDSPALPLSYPAFPSAAAFAATEVRALYGGRSFCCQDGIVACVTERMRCSGCGLNPSAT